MEVDVAGATLLRGGMTEPRDADDLIALVHETYESLKEESDYSPANQRVTGIIKRLSQRLRCAFIKEDEVVQAVLANEFVRSNLRSLRRILSRAEFLAELHDSRQLTRSKDSVIDHIGRLSYWNVYVSLVGKELAMLRRLNSRHGGHANENSPIVFVGSGPLPLSPIVLNRFGGNEIICLEMDSEAYEASCMLLERAGLSNGVKIIQVNGSEFDYSGCNRIFLASLVQNKTEVLNRIAQSSPNPLVAIRTAEGIRQIMYEAVDETHMNELGW
ncbi:MAG: Nicotianamine synthase, partial [Paenibacillus sp.]|nr:Nicotianamine synthase [Paenibacillus sp.]